MRDRVRIGTRREKGLGKGVDMGMEILFGNSKEGIGIGTGRGLEITKIFGIGMAIGVEIMKGMAIGVGMGG